MLWSLPLTEPENTNPVRSVSVDWSVALPATDPLDLDYTRLTRLADCLSHFYKACLSKGLPEELSSNLTIEMLGDAVEQVHEDDEEDLEPA